MPKLTPKQVQAEIEKGRLSPVYWIYGPERLKTRELIKRIRGAVIEEGSDPTFIESRLDGATLTGAQIVDEAKSVGLLAKTRFLLIQNAQAIDEIDALEELFNQKVGVLKDLSSVCVFCSETLDQRLKFSKLLVEKAAVIECEAVSERDREAWILYLAKRHELALLSTQVEHLKLLDPWLLEIVDQELAKFKLALSAHLSPEEAQAVLSTAGGALSFTEKFLDAFFSKQKAQALGFAEKLSEDPDAAIPLLGLFAWNVRNLLLYCENPRSLKFSSLVLDRFERWSAHWSVKNLKKLNELLFQTDFSQKQTAKDPLGLWSTLMQAHF